MYEILKDLTERPEPFSVATSASLWTDEHIAAGMLRALLDPATVAATRRPEAIDTIVGWLESRLGLSGKAVTDLGCGPGIYAERLAMHGAHVTGIDFSVRSLELARASAAAKRLTIDYRKADYLKDKLPEAQAVVTLIYGAYCVLSPQQRRALLARVFSVLRPGGHFIFDVFSRPELGQCAEEFRCERKLMNGFWAPGDYFGFKVTHLYPELYLSLDRYLIVEPHRQRDIFNWVQYFSVAEIEAELSAAGFETAAIFDLSTGGKWIEKSAPFGVLARRPAE